MKIEIMCPKCSWKPDGGKYWACSGCGFVWNTFDTAARCPQCGFVHEYTQCIQKAGGCSVSSLHEDWYKGLEDCIDEIKNELTKHNFEVV